MGYLALFLMSWRNRDWRLGAVAAVANYALQAGALSLGSVILVTGLQVTALLFALPIYARMSGAPVTRWDWCLGGDIGRRAGRRRDRRQSGGRIFAGAAAHLAGGCRHRGAVGWSVSAGRPDLAGWGDRSGAAGAVSGASLALFAVLVKGAVEAAEGGIVALLAAPELYAWIGAAVAGMVFQQSAYRGGPLNASMPTMTVAKPAVGSLLGITVLGETVQPGDETVLSSSSRS